MCQEINKEILHNEVYTNIQTGEVLDWERVSNLPDNAILKVKSDTWEIWDFKKNNELGFDIWNMTKGSDKKAWWYCNKYNDSYPMPINKKVSDRGCSICSGYYIVFANSLASLNPVLASEWHPTKNGKLTPSDVTCGSSSRKVWWKCELCHEWEATVDARNSGNGCPYCSNQKVWIGFNDMWTTNPELASLLADPENGYKYMQNSSSKVNWICPCCNTIIENKIIRNINKQGLFCPSCSDGVSYPEKFMFNLIKNYGVDFKYQKLFNWSKGKRYDFYIEYNSKKILIETHGAQHYEYKHRGRTLEEEQSNDKYKYEIAIENGIDPENYIVIDCRFSEIEWIKNNILNSRLAELFDLSEIDWERIHHDSLTSLKVKVLDLFRKGVIHKDIIRETGLSKSTINRYIRMECSESEKTKRLDSTKKPVIQLDLSLNYIKTWNSMTEASIKLKVNNISAVCRGERKTTGGYKWMYMEDYEKYIEEQNKLV